MTKKLYLECLEIINKVNDWRSQLVRGVDTALLLWDACIIPSLLYGTGTWLEISATREKRLYPLQQLFLRLILHIGPRATLASSHHQLWEVSWLRGLDEGPQKEAPSSPRMVVTGCSLGGCQGWLVPVQPSVLTGEPTREGGGIE